MDLQARMDHAVDNFLALSKIFMSDINSLLDVDDDAPIWRRNYIRMMVSLIEGYGHCYREMAHVGLECDSPEISSLEIRVLQSEGDFGAAERVKHTLKLTYKMFDLGSPPDFGSNNWVNAKIAINKRSSLMHPKSASDLQLDDVSWQKIHSGLVWLAQVHFDVTRLIHERHNNE